MKNVAVSNILSALKEKEKSRLSRDFSGVKNKKMDVAISVSLSLLVVCSVFLTVYLIGTLTHHDENET